MPTFGEIADSIADRIAAGEWKRGEKLPSTQEFADLYDVSEATAYRALVLLVDRGVIYGVPGSGRFVG